MESGSIYNNLVNNCRRTKTIIEMEVVERSQTCDRKQGKLEIEHSSIMGHYDWRGEEKVYMYSVYTEQR